MVMDETVVIYRILSIYMPVSEQFRFITNTEAESLIVYVGNDAYTDSLANYTNMSMLAGSRIDFDGIL